MIRKILLAGGVASSVLYAAMDTLLAARWEGYSRLSQAISELSAIGAPTRELWILPGALYTVLITGFGYGVWLSGRTNRRVRWMGGLILAYGALGLLWPFAPMHTRDAIAAGGGTFSDTMHLVLAGLTVPLMLAAIVVGTRALGRGFYWYSLVSLLVLAVCAALTFMDAPRIAQNLPTPFMGLWERINLGVFLLWVIVVGIALLRAPDALLGRAGQPERLELTLVGLKEDASSGTAAP